MIYLQAKQLREFLLVGRDKITDPMLQMRYLAFSGTMFACSTFMFIVFATHLIFGSFEPLLGMVPWLLAFPSLILLCRTGRFLLARILFFVIAWIGISEGVYLLGRDSMIGLYFLPAAFLPFLIFFG